MCHFVVYACVCTTEIFYARTHELPVGLSTCPHERLTHTHSIQFPLGMFCAVEHQTFRFGRVWRPVASQGHLAVSHVPQHHPLRNKVYVTFQTNEGDTPKIVAGLFGGSWLNPNRGRVPIAWGINLYV